MVTSNLIMEKSGMAFIPGGGAAQKAVTLDLMLRTFMNSPEFQPDNPRMWEGIARLVPGTTPQQRWEELKGSSRLISRDLSVLSARGKPISPQHDPPNSSRRHLPPPFTARTPNIGERYHFASMSAAELPPIFPTENRPMTARDPVYNQYRGSVYEQYRGSVYDQYRGSIGQFRLHSGQFTASFCQSHLYGTRKKEGVEEGEYGGVGEELGDYQEEEAEESTGNSVDDNIDRSDESPDSEVYSRTPSVNATVSSSVLCSPNKKSNNFQNVMLIHVKDEAKKLSKDFKCPRNVLVKEMRYFDEYLCSPGANQWEEVDISVHCDVSIFHWLMSYAKRGMREGPSGEPLDTPLESPKLEPSSTVSILISSDFLKMDSLVEECIQYCCENMSAVVASPCNMGCIGDHLLVRMAQKFTPLEVEELKDPKDKIKDKLYMYMMERMFSPTHSQPQCPVNGSTLFRCKHCGCLLTRDQQLVFPCANHRLKVDRNGGLVHEHEGEDSWDINKYIGLLRKKGLKWRDIYWRLWGILTWFRCSLCGEPFQSRSIKGCVYHPGTLVSSASGSGSSRRGGRYSCCNEPVTSFTPLLSSKSGCRVKDHMVHSSDDQTAASLNILTLMRDAVTSTATIDGEENRHLSNNRFHGTSSSLFSSEQKSRHSFIQESSHILKQRALVGRPHSTSTIKKSLPEPLLNDETIPSTKGPNKLKTTSVLPKRSVKVQRRSALEDEESSSEEPSSSELEEDEDVRSTGQKVVKMVARPPQKKTAQFKKHNSVLRSRSSERSMGDWEWDCSKSVRWNQDMQRDDDEKKLNHIKQHLQQLTTSEKGFKTPSISKGPDNFAGGIFCRIEAQFRAQRMMATLANKQSGQRSFRRSNFSSSKF